jgi:hypothetical protein
MNQLGAASSLIRRLMSRLNIHDSNARFTALLQQVGPGKLGGSRILQAE